MTPEHELTVATIQQRASSVRDRIRSAGGDPGAVTLVAVTKASEPVVLELALEAGLLDVGENYAQELVDKVTRIGTDELARRGARVHFVGRLQRNKVRVLAPIVHLWQTVDRAELATEIARRAPGASVLVQVNASGEATKGGCPPEAAADLVEHCRRAALGVRGLMTVGVAGDDGASRRAFATVATLADDLDLPVRSMGMSADLELAVAAGATMVRVGQDLFGPRPLPPARMPDDQPKRIQ